jgi:hypothetical protein
MSLTSRRRGADVVATGSGAIDLTGLTFVHTFSGGPAEIIPHEFVIGRPYRSQRDRSRVGGNRPLHWRHRTSEFRERGPNPGQ